MNPYKHALIDEKKYNLTIEGIKKTYPELEKIFLEYQGSGDSFGDMWTEDTIPVDIHVDTSDFEDLLEKCLEQCDFNNDGSKGTFEIDLINNTIKHTNYIIIQKTELEFENEYKL